ncbi:hypothetical protein [Streptococcus pseudoporcinus]|nr:hypothetical protein [Streptococcus pseudoporcinus]
MKRIIMSLKKDQLQKAFEEKQSLKLTYKLKVNKEKFNKSNSRRRRALSESESNPEKIISNTISYKINENQANGQNLEDVKLTYSKKMVPVPEIDGEVIKPQVPSLPELTPIIEYGSNLDFDEETIYHLPIEHGRYESNIPITISEDTKSDNLDIIVEGNIIDFVKDSITDNSYTKSGHNSADNNQATVEDTRSNLDIITINGQGEPIEFIEHTQTGISGQSEEITFIKETRKSEMTISGQSDSVEIIEDTQPGMSGFNKATVVDKDKWTKTHVLNFNSTLTTKNLLVKKTKNSLKWQIR